MSRDGKDNHATEFYADILYVDVAYKVSANGCTYSVWRPAGIITARLSID